MCILAKDTRSIGALNCLLRGGAGCLSGLARGPMSTLTFTKYAASSWVFTSDLARHLENRVLGLRVEFRVILHQLTYLQSGGRLRFLNQNSLVNVLKRWHT